jgi:thymidylate synthase
MSNEVPKNEVPKNEVPKNEVPKNEEKHEEQQYLDLIRQILEKGSVETGRNGNTISTFGASMRFNLQNNTIPILTTKQTAWKTCLKELLWFIRGETNNKILQSQNVHIWDANATPEYLKTRGLSYYEEGELGPIYGYQWRHFNGNWFNHQLQIQTNPSTSLKNDGVDQLQQIIDQLKNPETRTSRRLIMTAWNPSQLDQMALPPCHILCQFNVHDGDKLSCSMYQRSGDVGLGVPFNIASYSFLTHIIAKHCGLHTYEFIYFLGNAHIYDDHIEQMKEQITRNPYAFPKIEITNTYDNINDYTIQDIKIHEYKSHPKIQMNVRA